MGHNLQSLGTASLDTFGGLITLANPTDLPEGASSRCYDVDFIVGSVFQRYGLASVFTFSGEFAGPNLGGTATVIDSGGTPWSNPTGILGDTGFASNVTGATSQGTQTPTAASNKAESNPWVNPTHIFATGATYATVSLVTGDGLFDSAPLLADGMTFSIPATATVVGIQTSIKVGASGVAAGVASINVQLATNGNGIGSKVNVPITSTPETYLQGSAGYQWGTVLSPSIVNGSALGILIEAQVNPTTGVASFSANTLTVTVFYTTAATGNVIQDQTFSFSIPSTAGVSGFEVTFTGKSSAATVLTFQMLKNGIAVGNSHTQVLTPSAEPYSLGAANDLWGSSWTYADVNNTNFGVQITASGSGTSYAENVQIKAYITPSLSNFNWVTTYEQNNDQTYTLALDNSGILWVENLTNDPGVLAVGLTGILPGSYAKSATIDDAQYIVFSDLQIGTERPRVVSENNLNNGLQYQPLSQVGPGAPPSFLANAITSYGESLAITGFSISANVLTLTYVGTDPTPGTAFTLADFPSPYTYLNTSVSSQIISVITASGGSLTASFIAANASASVSAIALPLYLTPITSIMTAGTPGATYPFDNWWAIIQNNDGSPSSTTPGNIVTVYYYKGGPGATFPGATAGPADPFFAANAAAGLPTYVQISKSTSYNGVWLVTNNGIQQGPGGDSYQYAFFQFQVDGTPVYSSIGNTAAGSAAGAYQFTQALVISAVPLLGVSSSQSLTITQASPNGWNGSWPTESSNSLTLNITQTSLASGGVATYSYTVASGSSTDDALPTIVNGLVTIVVSGSAFTVGSPVFIQITGCTNSTNLGNSVFNISGYILNTAAGSFTLQLGTGTQTASAQPENGQGVLAGTRFTIDPGATNLGRNGIAIFGNDTKSGYLSVAGGTYTPIGAGVRQAVVFFITDSGEYTPCSTPVIFTVSEDANSINASAIPIGPPNVIARGIAFTEAGQYEVAGANFYFIPNPVTVTQLNGQSLTYTSTIVNDNTSTTASFTFTDAILLDSEEIDVQGNDLFNLIELGSCAWCLPYADRMFYGLQLNKVLGFVNMSFDGGYLNASNPQPLGWTQDVSKNPPYGPTVTATSFSITNDIATIVAPNSYKVGQSAILSGFGTATYFNGQIIEVLTASGSQFTFAFVHGDVSSTADTGTANSVNTGASLQLSPVTGDALYTQSTIEVTTTVMGFYAQPAFQDYYGVAIIKPNTQYSVRVAASNPSGVKTGSLVIELVNYNAGTGYGQVYGSFTVPYSSMSSVIQVFSGALLTTPFVLDAPGNNPPGAVPSGLQLAFYQSNIGYGADCLIDRIEVYPTSQPYLLQQVYGSYADSPESIDAGLTGGIIDTTSENSQTCYGGFVMHDLMYLLKTGSMYSTEDDPNSEPGGWGLHEVSNKVGTCGINSYDTGEEWAVTACRQGIFGFNGGQPQKLMQEIYQIWDAINWKCGYTIVLRNDMPERKMYCAIPLPTPNVWLPYAEPNANPTTPNVILMLNYQGLNDFSELVSSAQMHTTMFGTLASVDMKRKWTIWQIPTPYMDAVLRQDGTTPILFCNGIASSKIYELSATQYSDDGVAINALYTTYGFVNAAKAATVPIFGFHAKLYTTLQFTTFGQGNAQIRILPNVINPRYPYTVPGGVNLSDPCYDDYFRPLNIRGNRCFIEFSTNAVGSYFNLSKILLSGKAHPWSPINPTGGGNNGV